jgi:hypothetical protein
MYLCNNSRHDLQTSSSLRRWTSEAKEANISGLLFNLLQDVHDGLRDCCLRPKVNIILVFARQRKIKSLLVIFFCPLSTSSFFFVFRDTFGLVRNYGAVLILLNFVFDFGRLCDK